MSLGGVVVLVNCIIATRSGTDLGTGGLSIAIAMAVGVAAGSLNGFLVAHLGVQSVAATISTMIMTGGLALVILPTPGGVVWRFISVDLVSSLGNVLPISLVIIVVLILAWIIVRRTRFVAHVYAIGSDEKAALQSGINVRRTKFCVYAVAGLLYAIAGIMLSAQTGTGDPNASALFMVLVFGAVAIGGAKFGGGYGSALGSICGALILTVMQKALFAVGVSTFYTGIIQGAVLIVAVLIGAVSMGLATRSGTSQVGGEEPTQAPSDGSAVDASEESPPL